ncbi:MAG: hypothetical protein LBI82_02575 [Dysgonamonadaceae bacterium]|jgi:hypothetical protein|nr:hypothetical protein [Dysgonamonadaceae bacterium]
MNMKFIRIILVSVCAITLAACSQPSVFISYDDTSRQERYAADALSKSLTTSGYMSAGKNSKYTVVFSIDSIALVPEAFSIVRQGKTVAITGGDERGLIYGALELAEDIRNGVSIDKIKDRNEKPHLMLRAIKYDLPWDTYRHSEALSLHDQTCRDTTYWEAFLNMMAENRLNSLSLWNLHPYPFMIVSRDYPEANPWTEEEAIEWQKLFHAIIRMAKDRAIDTYIIPFNIFVTSEFAIAHNVAMDNLDRHFYVRGETAPIVVDYTRSCVTQVLEEYPDLSGFGLTLGEGMAGMTPKQREEWMTATIIEGMRQANRKSKLIHRVPFSSTTESLGITSIETEKITRATIEREYDMGFSDGPIFADFKFNWSHAHSTLRLIKVHGGPLYDTYFNPVPDKYKVSWTARNEDFFCLRWGVPEFVREHIKTNSPPYVGGYFIGSETYIPAKDYFTADTTGTPWYAFERQWLFYKIWGRLLYNPDTPDEVFHNEFVYRYGDKGKKLLEASSLAGKTPLRFASNFDCGWDFTLYSEGMMALNPRSETNPTGPNVEYVSIDRLINQPPLDTTFVNIKEYVKVLSEGSTFAPERTTPIMLADMLERDCTRALELVKNIKPVDNDNPALKYELADIRAWSYLGLHYAEKLRAAVALQTARTTGNETKRTEAIAHLEKGLSYWDEVIAITRPLYKDMPLTHLSEQGGRPWRENDHLRFHWEIIRFQVAKDLELAKK